jgi:hypothetical protein
MEWRTWTKRAAWLCVAVYLYIGFIAYPARRSGGNGCSWMARRDG